MSKDLPPYVRFIVRAVEDRTKALEGGHYGFKDLEIALITRPGSRDTVEKEAVLWLAELDKRAADGMVPVEWATHFRTAYKEWKAGNEAPLTGTPIRGWPVLLPAHQENLILANIRTVEDLANADEAALQHFGMGGHSLKTRAQAWLAAADTGKVTMKVEALHVENTALKEQLKDMRQRFEALEARLPKEPA